jgi:hypothetical protein
MVSSASTKSVRRFVRPACRLGEAKRFRCLDVGDQLELGRLLNRQITRLLAFANATVRMQHSAIL